MSVKYTYRFDGVLVNFGFCLPQMMTIYIDKRIKYNVTLCLHTNIISIHAMWTLMEHGNNLQMILIRIVQKKRWLLSGCVKSILTFSSV